VLTTSQVAQLLRVTTSTVARWAHEGKIPCHYTFGGHRRFDRSVIEELRETVDRLGSWSERAADELRPSRGGVRRKGRRQR
jgi:excisionase family DNA binding protein